jgi:hypothetical protein
VSTVKTGNCRASQLIFLCCTLSAASNTAASICANRALTWQAAHVSNTSTWQEFDALGKKLLHESGTLQGRELTAGLKCENWWLQADLSQLDGTRLYEGQTTSGFAITTQSALRQSRGQLQTSFAISEAWQLGARIAAQTTWRDIASAGGASGYPEQFDWTLLSLGTQWKTTLGPGQLTLAAWAGSQIKSRMLLTLPGRDKATLQLGTIRELELAAGWRLPLNTAWSLQADARYRHLNVNQGLARVITRNGVPVAVANQPKTSNTDIPLALRINYEF